MGQREILVWLYEQRVSGNPHFFSLNEIKQNTKGNDNTRNQINKLFWFGYLDVETKTGWMRNGKKLEWNRKYRLRKSRIEEIERMRRK